MSDTFGAYNNKLFVEVWANAQDFLTDYGNNGIPTTIQQSNVTLLYYLLYSRYGNTPIASTDENRFKYAVMATIFQYGPTWEKRLEIQEELRGLTAADLEEGSSDIFNHAYNPDSEPSTQTTEEINYINEQNTRKHKRSKLDSYALLMNLLETDVTGAFLAKFNKLFMPVVSVQNPVLYSTDNTENLEV